MELAGLKKFEAFFRESVQDIINSERLELIPMEKILYRGPVVALDETGTKGDVVSFNEERSDDIYEWGSSHVGVENPLASRQQNFFGKKSYLKDEPVTERTVRLRGQTSRRYISKKTKKCPSSYKGKGDRYNGGRSRDGRNHPPFTHKRDETKKEANRRTHQSQYEYEKGIG